MQQDIDGWEVYGPRFDIFIVASFVDRFSDSYSRVTRLNVHRVLNK